MRLVGPLRIFGLRPLNPVPVTAANRVEWVDFPVELDGDCTMICVRREADAAERLDVATSRIVIAGGRGVGSKDNFKLLEKHAGRLKAAVGASRAAVEAGYAPYDAQVGLTGKKISADLYVACGISGAFQHLAGIQAARTVIAINSDPSAPIFQHCDYGIVGDLFEVLPELTSALQRLPRWQCL
jgi:electron transfer flavoprotein alpha subunit